MSLNTTLFSAVEALQLKLAERATTATAEELAYLGTALERLSGPLTMKDLVELANQIKQELTDRRVAEVAEINDQCLALVATVTNQITSLQNAFATSLANLKVTEYTAFVNQVTTAKNTAIADVQAAINNAQTAKTDLQTVATAAKNDTAALTDALAKQAGLVYWLGGA